MPFPVKLRLLISASILVFAGLCWMQYRLVVNTYRLEKAAFQRQLTEELAKKGQSLTDSLNHRAMEQLINTVKFAVQSGRKPDLQSYRQSLQNLLQQQRNALNNVINSDSLLSGNHYSFRYTRIVIIHDGVQDTLLSATDHPVVVFGDLHYENSQAFSVGQSQQQAGIPARDTAGKTRFYRLAVWTDSTLAVPGWRQTVIRSMLLTLAGSGLLILSALLIFTAAFIAIFRQKRTADVVTDFVNNMTHELKTPLSSAGIAVKSLRTDIARRDIHWTTELLDQLDRQLDRIGRLVDSALSSAVEGLPAAIRLKRFDLNVILADLEHTVNDSGRRLIMKTTGSTIVSSDADQLTGILANLMDNALKYTSGMIQITADTTAQMIRIIVKDEGPIIPSIYRAQLFDKFFRVPQEGKRHIQGLGLGLYICRKQARMLGGELVYRQISGGNEFILTIPNETGADLIG